MQAAWDREKDDERVYRSPEMNTLWDEVHGMRRNNELVRDKAFQLDDKIGEKRGEENEAMKNLISEERRLGGTLKDFKKEYKLVMSKLELWRKKKVQYRKKLRSYGVKIDKKGNIITVQNE